MSEFEKQGLGFLTSIREPGTHVHERYLVGVRTYLSMSLLTKTLPRTRPALSEVRYPMFASMWRSSSYLGLTRMMSEELRHYKGRIPLLKVCEFVRKENITPR